MGKFKNWLIRKLGGYTTYQVSYHKVFDVHIDTLRAACIVDPHLEEWNDYYESIKECLTHKIINEMREKDYINFSTHIDENNQKVIYAEVKAVKGE